MMQNTLNSDTDHKEEIKTKRSKDKSEFAALNNDGVYGTVTEPRKSLSTFFRNQNKFEVSAVSILDKKAAILIKICTTLISGLIVFNEHILNNVVGGNIILLTLLIGLLTALILSVLATKPSTRNLRKIVNEQIKPLHSSPEENVFYMWNNDNLEQYEKAMEKVIKSQDLQLGNQIRANFILGRNNVNRAKYIDYSYTAFLLSFLIVGIVFILFNYVI